MNTILLLALSWLVHGWSGYKPAPTISDETVDGRVAKHVTHIQGKHGGCIYTNPRLPCRAGDTVHVSFEVKGSGKGFATVARYSEKGGFNQTCKRREFELGDKWQRHEADFYIADGTDGRTASYDFQVGAAQGCEILVANVEMSVDRRAFDDFEGCGPHAGGAEIIEGNIAPGLLSRTGLGLIVTDSPRKMELEQSVRKLPTSGSNPFLESSVRVYSFGRTERKSSTLDVKFAAKSGDAFALRIAHEPAKEMLSCTMVDHLGGKSAACGRMNVPYTALPADFVLLAGANGEVRLEVSSLADSSCLISKASSKFFAGRKDEISTHMLFTPRQGKCELVIDNYSVGRASSAEEFKRVPCTLEKAKSFDPVKEGWPLVFADEFDGTKIDFEKWEPNAKATNGLAFVENGLLHIQCDWDEQHKKLRTSSLWTKEKWQYGYFESRVRFTRNSGWWAAFWLCRHSTANPFKDGFEIDIFEDYYTRCDKPDGVHKPILDHNLHMFGSSILKSWNYRSELPGSLDDFYVIGCKWTPFEISYYLNGKLIRSKALHSKHDSVTFDAISHGVGFSPLSAIVSGQIMNETWFCHDTTGFTFPEDYLVDYVRVYAYPQPDGPSVEISCEDQRLFAKPGNKLGFKIRPQVAKDGAKITAAYLFDSGYLLDYRTEPPYDFTIDLTAEAYAKTRYMRPGRSGKVTPFEGTGLHVFAAYVLDEKGRYAHTEKPIEKLVCDYEKSRPYRGVAQKIPGTVRCGLYDEGGPGIAYSDATPENTASKTFRTDEGVDASTETTIGSVNSGEWLTYSVDIEKTGDYRAVFTYGTPEKGNAKLHVFVDGMKAGVFACPAHAAPHWGADTKSTIERMHLPAGRHRMTIVCEEKFNFSTLTFTPVE